MAASIKLRHARLLTNKFSWLNSSITPVHRVVGIKLNENKIFPQQHASYASRLVKNKNYFSRTYQPRFDWARELPSQQEVNSGLSPENQLEFDNKTLHIPYSSGSPLVHEPWPRQSWKGKGKGTIRTGLLAVKIGVVPQWTVKGKKILCTMLQVLDNHVIDYQKPKCSNIGDFSKMAEIRRRLGVCIVGAMSASPLEFSEEYNQLFVNSGVPPKRKLTKFFVTENAAVPPGTPLNAQHFRVGDYVDLNARTIDMGFQGVLTRWGMKGGRASHGVTKAHRRIGSIGGGGDKGGIWKGKKMPGHMGSRFIYHRGVQIVRINTKYNVIYVRGPNVPGPPRAYVRILDTVLPNLRPHLQSNPPPMPTFYPEDAVPDTPDNLYHESLFTYDDDYVSYEGMNPDNLFLYNKQYILYGGTRDGKNHSYRRGL